MTAVINPLSQQPRRAGWRNATGWAIVLSVAAHLLVALAMLTARAQEDPCTLCATLGDDGTGCAGCGGCGGNAAAPSVPYAKGSA